MALEFRALIRNPLSVFHPSYDAKFASLFTNPESIFHPDNDEAFNAIYKKAACPYPKQEIYPNTMNIQTQTSHTRTIPSLRPHPKPAQKYLQ